MSDGTLYIVATPIGNRADISARALQTLKEVDVIAAEDTRHSGHLMRYLDVRTPLLAYHDHNEREVTPELIARLSAGESVALISDAGTPLVSDPGYRLVRAAHEAGVAVSPIPGCSAAIAALSVAGLASDRFAFEGFPPVKTAARQNFYEALKHETRTLIFYESSHRIVASLRDLLSVIGGERELTLAREVTKAYETIKAGTVAEIVAFVEADKNQQRGEFVLLLASDAVEQLDDTQQKIEQWLPLMLEQMPVKTASQLLADMLGVKRKPIYQRALELKG